MGNHFNYYLTFLVPVIDNIFNLRDPTNRLVAFSSGGSVLIMNCNVLAICTTEMSPSFLVDYLIVDPKVSQISSD